MIDGLILGANPFSGVDHYMQGRARERAVRINERTIETMLEAAYEEGARGFTFSLAENFSRLLEQIRGSTTFRNFNLYPLIPNIGRYHNQLLGGGTAGVVDSLMQDLGWGQKAKAAIRGGWSYVTKNPKQAIRAAIDIEMDNVVRVTGEGSRIVSVFLHEFFTDVALSHGLVDLLSEYCDHLRDSYHVIPGLQTRNFQLLVSRLTEKKTSLEGSVVMAPFNPIGFQMPPSREANERALQVLSNTPVVAISILAGGKLSVKEAAEYLGKFPQIRSVAVGASTSTHIRETFGHLRNLQQFRNA